MKSVNHLNLTCWSQRLCSVRFCCLLTAGSVHYRLVKWLHQVWLHDFNVFPQRGECWRGLPGSSKEDLPEHPRWQSGPERCRVGSPAQTVCTARRSSERRQPAGQRRLQLLTTDRNYRPIRRTDTDNTEILSTRHQHASSIQTASTGFSSRTQTITQN